MKLNQTLHFTFPQNNKLELLIIRMFRSQYLNVTVIYLTYNGTDNINCTYAGLSSYDVTNNSYKEISTV